MSGKKKMSSVPTQGMPSFYEKSYEKVALAAAVEIANESQQGGESYEPFSANPPKGAEARTPSHHNQPQTSTQKGVGRHLGEDNEYADEYLSSGYHHEINYQPSHRSSRRCIPHSMGISPEGYHHNGTHDGYPICTPTHTPNQFTARSPDRRNVGSFSRATEDYEPQYSAEAATHHENIGFEEDRGQFTETPEDHAPPSHGPRSAMSIDEYQTRNEDLFVPSETSDDDASQYDRPPRKTVARHNVGRRRTFATRSLRPDFQVPRYTENGRVYKQHRRCGRPSSGAIINAPHFQPILGNLNYPQRKSTAQERLAQVLEIDSPESQFAPSRCFRKPRWEVNKAPKLTDIDSLSPGSLIKHGIDRETAGKKVSISTRGVNDPENIAIVNMKDVEGLSFDEIAIRINQDRIKRGKNPDMKGNSANCRYNRTAPALYQMANIPFTRIADRANGNGDITLSRSQEEMIWTGDMDEALVLLELEYQREKWFIIATKLIAMFPEEDWITEKQVAIRYSHM